MQTNESNTKEPYDGDGWSDGQQSLGGGPTTGQAEFDVPESDSESEPEPEPEGNPGGLLADERENTGEPAGENTENGQIAQRECTDGVNPGGLMADQRELDDENDGDGDDADPVLEKSEQATLFGSTPDRVDLPFDEYGPTSRRSLPLKEYATLPGADGLDYRELPGTGLAPSDFEILSGICSPKTAARHGFHPDDMIDPNAHDKHGEAMARAHVLEQAARPRQAERGDR